MSERGVPRFYVQDRWGEQPVPGLAWGEPVEGEGGIEIDLQTAPDALELLAHHADVRLVDDEPALGAVGVQERPNVFTIMVQAFRKHCIEQKEGAFEHLPGLPPTVEVGWPRELQPFPRPFGNIILV